MVTTSNCSACGAPIFWAFADGEHREKVKLNSIEEYAVEGFEVVDWDRSLVRRTATHHGYTIHECPQVKR